MDYKKKYEELVGKIEKAYLFAQTNSTKAVLEEIRPELKESGDERMWKLIKKYARYRISDMTLDADHITREQLVSWLEKQGEQILANSAKTCKDEQKPVEWSEEDEKIFKESLTKLRQTNQRLPNMILILTIDLLIGSNPSKIELVVKQIAQPCGSRAMSKFIGLNGR